MTRCWNARSCDDSLCRTHAVKKCFKGTSLSRGVWGDLAWAFRRTDGRGRVTDQVPQRVWAKAGAGGRGWYLSIWNYRRESKWEARPRELGRVGNSGTQWGTHSGVLSGTWHQTEWAGEFGFGDQSTFVTTL